MSSTRLDPPAAAVARRRNVRSRRTTIAAIAGSAGLALAAGAIWVSNYQPLSGGTSGYAAGLTSGGGYDAVGVDNVIGTELRIRGPEAGDEIGMLFPLQNDGPLGVTILRVGQPFNPTGVTGDGLQADDTSAGRAMRATDLAESEWIDVMPFSLPAGRSVPIRLTFDVLDCATELTAGSLDTVTTVPITYRVVGLTRTAYMPLPYAMSIESLPHCPGPRD